MTNPGGHSSAPRPDNAIVQLGIRAVGIYIVLIWLAAALTLITGYDYLRTGLKHMAEDAPMPGNQK